MGKKNNAATKAEIIMLVRALVDTHPRISSLSSPSPEEDSPERYTHAWTSPLIIFAIFGILPLKLNLCAVSYFILSISSSPEHVVLNLVKDSSHGVTRI